ncbi:MAG: hypothetical protein E7671_00645 [Ruminococcaceae bacterium]|nr:hypothetical protein [Oscillospiraceae bacterium]
MKETELKPCPFCGGEGEIVNCHVYLDDAIRVRCRSCHVVTHAVLIDHPAYTEKSGGELDESTRYTKEQAAAVAASMWNRRADNEQREAD